MDLCKQCVQYRLISAREWNSLLKPVVFFISNFIVIHIWNSVKNQIEIVNRQLFFRQYSSFHLVTRRNWAQNILIIFISQIWIRAGKHQGLLSKITKHRCCWFAHWFGNILDLLKKKIKNIRYIQPDSIFNFTNIQTKTKNDK